MTDATDNRAANLRDVRGLREDEMIRSWHGHVHRGRAGNGYYLDIYAYTSQRRRYRLGIDVYGGLYASDGRVTPKKLLGPERRPDDIENDLRVYRAAMEPA